MSAESHDPKREALAEMVHKAIVALVYDDKRTAKALLHQVAAALRDDAA